MTYFIKPSDEVAADEILEHCKTAVDTVREIDKILSSNLLGIISPLEVCQAMYEIGLGNMTRGEILKNGGWA